MKLAYTEYAKFNNSNVKKEDTLCLILEDVEDVVTYFDYVGEKDAKKLIGAWGLITENVERGQAPYSHLPYDPVYVVAGVLAAKGMSKKKYSLLHLATDFDSIIADKMQTMLKFITNGDKVRVNWKGGYSSFNDIFNVTEEVPADEHKIRQYLMLGTLSEDGLPDIKIKTDTLVIENDVSISRELYWDYLQKNNIEYDRFYEFKSKTNFLKYEQLFELFDSFIQSGITHIVTETTMNDKMQILTMKKILQKVMDQYPDKKLKVSIMLNGEDTEGILKTDRKNLKINIIK